MPKAEKEVPFEKNLEQLENIVAALEEGGLSLDDSLKRFEEGVRLWRACEKALGAAEKKIEMLTKNAQGELETRPFGDGPDSAPDDPLPPEPPEEEEEDEDGAELLF